MSLKITTWNLEHADRLLGEDVSDHVADRRQRVRETIQAINPDILCIQEGPRGEQGIVDFARLVLDDAWLPVLLKEENDALGDRDAQYEIKGTQWIWFLVRSSLLPFCKLQSPTVWQSFSGSKTWQVNFWGIVETSRHSYFRHPQVMIFQLPGGETIELIGVHLKSKINRQKIERDAQGNLSGEYVDEATKARIKLATEARNVREYITAKFNQLAQPGIVVMGDCNDGPGNDLFETQYLFFDLIANLQGEVLFAERFFNHALFDFPGHLRWTARYRDEVLEIPASQNPLLLDHILVSQPLCRGTLPLIANENAGQVEHEAFEQMNAGANSKTASSDHRPVSCVLEDTTI